MMFDKTNLTPKREDVEEIIRRIFDENAAVIERFPTGNCHFVFDVRTQNARKFVVRISKPENRDFLRNAIYWNKLLRPKGVPLAEILASDLDEPDFPFIILERLEGKDLGLIYKQLTKAEKKSLVIQLSKIQEITATLPKANNFGFVGNYETDTFCQTWTDVLRKSLDRSRQRIKQIGLFEAEAVGQVEGKIAGFESYFSQIEPIAFLDDITTKNVIVNDGKLSGIVDVDCVCFGDNLFTVALTRMSLLSTNDDLDYIEFWCDEMNLSAQRKKVLDFYTALFCVDFMSEIGHAFNKEKPLQIDEERFARLHSILDNLLKSI
jgi:Phosphotransferase enzyme family